MDNLKIFKKLPIPEDSAWDRKSYNPYTLFRRWIYNKFRYTWFENVLDKCIFTPIHNCDNGIRNLYRWFSVIWKDRDWDHSYIFGILKYKLIRQREYLVSNNRHLGIDQDNRDMTICLNLIERIQQEYYGLEYMDYKQSNIRFEKTGNQYEGEDTYKMEEDLISERYDEFLNRYKSTVRYILKNGYRGRKIDIEDKDILCMYVSQYNQEKCQRLLFNILNDRILGWWD